MGQSATTDPLSLVLSIGDYQLTGYAGASPIRWASAARHYEMVVGIQGLGAFGKISNNSASLVVDLMQTSDDNGVLNGFRKLDKETYGGVGVSASLIDITGTDSHSCNICHLDGPPDMSKGAPGEIYTWTILGIEWVTNVGGRGPTPTVNFGDLPASTSEIPVLPPPV